MKTFNIHIKRYEKTDISVWNDFIDKTKNGTFLHKRAYMDYHADRFEDFSLMIFEKNKLVALLPANKKDKILYSHQGLTYGSLLVSIDISQSMMLAIFEELKSFLKSQKFEKLYYKVVPVIYHKLPCEEDLYALFRNNAKLVVRNCSTTFDIQKSKHSSKLRLSRISKNVEIHNLRYEINFVEGFAVHENTNAFWSILEDNLMQKHGVKPVHSLEEINLLQALFPKNIQSISVFSDNKIVAGGVVYLVNDVAHLQYAAVSPEGEKMYAGEFLYELFIHKLYSEFNYFDFGISTEKGGQILNESLIAYKEKFGGNTVVYDHYEMSL